VRRAARALFLASALGCGAPTEAQDWPWWRGPERDGVARSDAWSSQGRELWRTRVGVGFACPSIVGASLWIVGHERESKQDTLWCLDSSSGEVRWKSSYPARRGGFDVHPGGPLSQPTVGNERVYVSSNEGAVRAFDARTRELLWLCDLPRLLGTKPDEYGIGASPVLLGDALVVCADRVARLDARTGELRWASAALGVFHSTPAPLTFEGREHLAVFGDRGVTLLALADGAPRGLHPWKDLHIGGSIATPVVLGEDLLVSSGSNVGATRLDFRTDPPRVVWHTRAMRNLMAGCVRVGDHLYGFDESILKCLDLDGKELWRERGLGDGSMIAAGTRLLVMTSDGELLVARASPLGFEELARHPLFQEGDFWSPPVFAQGRVYVRSSLGELVCLVMDGGAEAPRSSEASPSVLPDARALFERHLELVGGKARVEALVSLRRRGTFECRALGVQSVPIVLEERAPALRREEIGLPRGLPGKVVRGFDGELAWELNPIRGDGLLDAAGQREARDEPGLHATARWADELRGARTRGAVSFAGRRAWKVEASLASGTVRHYYFDRESGYLCGRDGVDQATVVWDDWRVEGGLAFPMFERREVRDTGVIEVLRFETLELDAVPAEAFRRPAELSAAPAEVPPK
jgi:outer membrane protein assembly factor BamB